MLRLTLLLLSSPLAASLVLTHRVSVPRAIAASRSRALFAAEEAKIAELRESIEAAAARQDYAAAAELQQLSGPHCQLPLLRRSMRLCGRGT